ncbi:hypothetical protein [Bradyrhizobium sp. LHD-71]|nr:hypothetical protein [Bradyrhizobium sp. LHD-71]MDQ8727935.1 hypothetical protein [Bradyrhizobium sp. LHD-71]
MTNARPPLLPPLSARTAVDYVLIAANIAVAIAVIYVRLVA